MGDAIKWLLCKIGANHKMAAIEYVKHLLIKKTVAFGFSRIGSFFGEEILKGKILGHQKY